MTEKRRIADEFEDDELQNLRERFGEFEEREFHVGRISGHGHDEFMALADEMFAGDYGATITFLLEHYKRSQSFAERHDQLQDRVNHLEQKVAQLINKLDENNTERKTTLND